MKTPKDLTREELQMVVQGVLDAMYPNCDPDTEWSPDTLDNIASILATAGLAPKDGEWMKAHGCHCDADVPMDDCESTSP